MIVSFFFIFLMNLLKKELHIIHHSIHCFHNSSLLKTKTAKEYRTGFYFFKSKIITDMVLFIFFRKNW